jgi:hypothetical protein
MSLELEINKSYSYQELKEDYMLIRFGYSFSLWKDEKDKIYYFKHIQPEKDKPLNRFNYQSELNK